MRILSQHILLSLIFSFNSVVFVSQEDATHSILGEVVVSADNKFDVESFIHVVTKDSTFYQSFLNLKYYPHHFAGSMTVRNKKEVEKGTLKRTAIQTLDEGHRIVNVTEEEITGKLLNKKGEFNYLTAEMYDEVFFPKNPEKVGLSIESLEQAEEKGSKMDKYKSQVKKMMFNPGSEINSVPFIGHKMAIFSEEMVKYYDYHISSGYTKDSIYCYIFDVTAKPEFRQGATVIKHMKSYFDKESLNVMDREYQLQYKSPIMDFNIFMEVKNTFLAGHLIPKYVRYDGQWDIPFKKAEIIKFTIDNYNWKKN